MTHDTHKETIKDITIGTKQFNCDQLFKEGRSADPCGVVVVVPQWPGWLEYNCIQSSHGPAPRQCRGAGAKMASWQLPPSTDNRAAVRTEADGMETLTDCVGIIFQNEWGNPSGLVKNLLMWRFSIIYVWKWYGFYLARSCSVCCLMLTHDIVHTKVSTPDVFVTTDKREPGPRPPVTLSTWVQGHEHLQLAHSNTAWRGRLKKRDKITPTLWKLLTLCSPVVLHNLIFRVELVPLMSWYGHKWETGFDRIHLQIILVHWSIFTEEQLQVRSVQPPHVRSRGDWTSWLSAEEVSLSVQLPGVRNRVTL